jgi:transporter family-2 protein
VSGGNALAVVPALSVGPAGSAHAAVMGKLGERVGIFEALAFSTIVAIVVGFTALLLVRHSFEGIGHAARQPVWLWTGGALSAFIVLAVTGNLVMAALIDRLGWLGNDRISLHWPRVAGLVLLAAGSALTLRK